MGKRLVTNKKLISGRAKKSRSPSKKKRLTKKQLRVELRDRPGGWTNEWEGASAKRLTIGQRGYDVTLTDRLHVLEYHRKQLAVSLAKDLGLKVKLDKGSLVGQEDSYEGAATVLSYDYKISKSDQKTMASTKDDYWDIIVDRHGKAALDAYVKAENKAAQKTFGFGYAPQWQASVEETTEDGIHTVSWIMDNEWSRRRWND